MARATIGSTGQTLRTPKAPVQRPVLDRFRDVLGLDVGSAFQVSNRPRNLQDAVVGARAQALLLHGALQQALAIGGEVAVGADLFWRHLRVAIDFFSGGGKAVELAIARLHHPLADLR